MRIERRKANKAGGNVRKISLPVLTLMLLTLLLPATLAGCDGNATADGTSNGSSARGHVKFGLPF